MSPPGASYAQLLLATLLFASVALFGKLIEHSPAAISFGRAVFGAPALLLACWLLGTRRPGLARADLPWLALVGLFMAGNWGFLFLSIQTASVAVAVVALFTYPFLTVLLEPLFFNERYSLAELVGGLAVIAGVCLVIPEFSLANATTMGVVWGLCSAVCFSLYSMTSRRLVGRYGSLRLTLYVFLMVAVVFLPLGWREAVTFTWRDVGMFVLMGSLLTTTALALFVNCLKTITGRVASIGMSLQPLFATLLAYVVLGEEPAWTTAVGGVIIIAAVIGVMTHHHGTSRRRTASDADEAVPVSGATRR